MNSCGNSHKGKTDMKADREASCTTASQIGCVARKRMGLKADGSGFRVSGFKRFSGFKCFP